MLSPTPFLRLGLVALSVVILSGLSAVNVQASPALDEPRKVTCPNGIIISDSILNNLQREPLPQVDSGIVLGPAPQFCVSIAHVTGNTVIGGTGDPDADVLAAIALSPTTLQGTTFMRGINLERPTRTTFFPNIITEGLLLEDDIAQVQQNVVARPLGIQFPRLSAKGDALGTFKFMGNRGPAALANGQAFAADPLRGYIVIDSTGFPKGAVGGQFWPGIELTGAQVPDNKGNPNAFGVAGFHLDSDNNFCWRLLTVGIDQATTAGVYSIPNNLIIPLTPPDERGISHGCTSALTAERPDSRIRSVDDFIQAMVGGQIYVNIHSAVFPDGAIRGQLRFTPE
jgi:hypothetical protein